LNCFGNFIHFITSGQTNAKIEELLQEDHNAKRRREKFQKQSSLLSKLTRQLSIHDNRASVSSYSNDSPESGKQTAFSIFIFHRITAGALVKSFYVLVYNRTPIFCYIFYIGCICLLGRLKGVHKWQFRFFTHLMRNNLVMRYHFSFCRKPSNTHSPRRGLEVCLRCHVKRSCWFKRIKVEKC
jgi:hypothetical protein